MRNEVGGRKYGPYAISLLDLEPTAHGAVAPTETNRPRQCPSLKIWVRVPLDLIQCLTSFLSTRKQFQPNKPENT